MADPASKRNHWLAIALPALTFLLGAALGGLFVGVAMGSDSASDDAAASSPPNPTETGGTPSATLTVPEACTEAADKVTEAVGLLREGAAAIGNFQPKELTRVLNELEDLDPQLQELAKQCSAVGITTSPPES